MIKKTNPNIEYQNSNRLPAPFFGFGICILRFIWNLKIVICNFVNDQPNKRNKPNQQI